MVPSMLVPTRAEDRRGDPAHAGGQDRPQGAAQPGPLRRLARPRPASPNLARRLDDQLELGHLLVIAEGIALHRGGEAALRREAQLLDLDVLRGCRNGLSTEEIGEILLHSAVYAGVPAANAAFAVAQEVLRAEGLIE